jgi:hypothetical protein
MTWKRLAPPDSPVATKASLTPISRAPMFTEIRHAILPLALNRRHGGDDLQRATLLIESLSHHWQDPEPLQLLIVSPHRDVDKVGLRLPAFLRIEVSIHSERDFFPRFSRFYTLPGWYRQQIVKLLVPARLQPGGYLTLDSDVFCVDDFDATTFVTNGRALSRWEPKRQHEWWPRTARFVGVPYDAAAHGLSVTPNVLHSDLAHQALEHVGRGLLDAETALALRLVRGAGRIPWTEYALYTSVAERAGNLFDYHVHWDDCYWQDSQVFSEHSSVWHASDFERRLQRARRNPRAKFIVVQSKAGIPLDAVREYCFTVDSRKTGWPTEVASQ